MFTLVLGMVMALSGCSAREAPDLYALSARDNTLYAIHFDRPAAPIGRIEPVASNADLAMLTDAGRGPGGAPMACTIDRRANVVHTLRLTDGVVVDSVRLDVDVWVTRRGLARSPDGRFLALLPGMHLRTIDPATGATALIGPVVGREGSVKMIEAIAFSPDGELFALGSAGTRFSNALYRIDTVTAEATLVADLPIPDADALAFARGFLYAADAKGADADLWRIDPATGELVSLGTTGIPTLNGLMGPK